MEPLISSRVFARTALAGYAVVLFVATLGPLPDVKDVYAFVPIADKLVHAGLFGGLGAALYWNLIITLRSGAGLWSVALASAVAGLIEVLQDPLPYRSAEWWDFLSGAAGAVVAVMAVAWLFGHHLAPGPEPVERP